MADQLLEHNAQEMALSAQEKNNASWDDNLLSSVFSPNLHMSDSFIKIIKLKMQNAANLMTPTMISIFDRDKPWVCPSPGNSLELRPLVH